MSRSLYTWVWGVWREFKSINKIRPEQNGHHLQTKFWNASPCVNTRRYRFITSHAVFCSRLSPNVWVILFGSLEARFSECLIMMTSSNGNLFRVTGHLCGEFTGHWWNPHAKASDAKLWSVPEWTGKQSWGWWFETQSRPLWRHSNKWHLSVWSPPPLRLIDWHLDRKQQLA